MWRICSLIKIKPLTASYYFDYRVNQTVIPCIRVFLCVSQNLRKRGYRV